MPVAVEPGRDGRTERRREPGGRTGPLHAGQGEVRPGRAGVPDPSPARPVPQACERLSRRPPGDGPVGAGSGAVSGRDRALRHAPRRQPERGRELGVQPGGAAARRDGLRREVRRRREDVGPPPPRRAAAAAVRGGGRRQFQHAVRDPRPAGRRGRLRPRPGRDVEDGPRLVREGAGPGGGLAVLAAPRGAELPLDDLRRARQRHDLP